MTTYIARTRDGEKTINTDSKAYLKRKAGELGVRVFLKVEPFSACLMRV